MQNNQYNQALSKFTRDFIVIGLTGLAGSGFTRAVRILRNDRPDFPEYSQVYSSSNPKSAEDNLRVLEHDKLRRVFHATPWTKFVVIQTNVIIFALTLERCARCSSCGVENNKICTIAKEDSGKLSGLRHLVGNKPSADVDQEIINSYRHAESLFEERWNENTKFERIQQLQTFSANIRLYGTPLAESCDKSYDNLFIIPEAIRRVMKAFYRTGNKRIAIDSFRNPYEIEFFGPSLRLVGWNSR